MRGTTYAFLPKASANRVFSSVVPQLLAAELAVLDAGLAEPRRPTTATAAFGGVEYVTATVDGAPYGDDEVAVLSNLSTLHALFVVEGELLRPVALAPLRHHDDDLISIQRYAGKTNETFTHLLVNLALAATSRGFERLLAGERLRLLDPASGRGTSLNRAVVYGMDAVGVELDKRDVDAYEAFFVGWCKDKRLKHDVERARLRKGRAAPAATCTVTFGAGKDRAGQRTVLSIHDDTVLLGSHLAARSVDLLVCDLPYGVQHGARSDGALARGPADLLAAALPVWLRVLRPGSGLALGWNQRTLARQELGELVTAHGFELVPAGGDGAFVHRVDRSITRDVLVARRPAASAHSPASTPS
jgi:SAM-dependent methyltransferase